MNKIVTLSAIALIGSAAAYGMGNVPEGGRSLKAEIEALSSKMINVEKFPVENLKIQKKAASKETRADGWKSLGTGVYRECLLSCVFTNCPAQDIEVEIEESELEPGTYRLINPYANWQNPFSDVEYDFTGDYDMVIHTENVDGTDYIWIEEFNTGLYADGMGEIKMFTQVSNIAGQVGCAQIMEHYQDALGINDNGTMTYPQAMTVLTGEQAGTRFTNFLIEFSIYSQDNGYFGGNTSKVPFVVTLPGVEPPKPYDPFEHYAYVGKGMFLNNIMNPFLQEPEAEPYEVEIYDEGEGYHYLHIRGAWGEYSDDEHKNQDFVVNAVDPENIMIPWTETGYNDFEYGEISLMGYTYYYYQQEGWTKEQILSELKENVIYLDEANKRIVFPKNCVLYAFTNSENPNNLYEANPNYQYEGYLELPDEYFAGVKGVVTGEFDENAPVKYFNLQGMEVAQPAKGQLVIKKQGSKSVKMIAE